MCQIGHMRPEQLLGVAGNSSRRWQGALDMTIFWTVAKLWDERVQYPYVAVFISPIGGSHDGDQRRTKLVKLNHGSFLLTGIFCLLSDNFPRFAW